MNPPRRIGLNDAGDVGNGVYRRHSNEEMNMVGHTVGAERNPAQFAEDTAKISVEVGPDLRSYQWPAVTRAEDEMN